MSDYSKVYKELNEVFKYLPQEIEDKIPVELVNQIKNNMDNNYEYQITHISDFSNQSMMKETRAILAILYRDYWASEEERKEIIEEEKREILKKEEEKKNKYKGEYDIFKNQEKIEATVSQALVEYKEGIFKKIINKIMSWFRRY